jgi:hypothetical protein
MTKFQYTAINQQGKSLNGIIESESPENARRKLSSLKLTIVDLQQISDTNLENQNFSKYKFEGTNKEGKNVKGTISSSNLVNAFKKLVEEYELNVSKIASLSSSPEEFDASASKVPQLYEVTQKLSKNVESDTSINEYNKEQEKVKFQKLIEEIINLVRTIQSKYSHKLKPEAIQFLQKYEIHLNKIKFSDNVENISNSALKVLEQLQNSENFLHLTESLEEEMTLQTNYSLLSKRIRKYQNKEDELSSTIQKLLSKIGFKSKNNDNGVKANPLWIYLEILFKTKSNQIRKGATLEFFKNFFKKINKTTAEPLQNKSKFKLQTPKLNSLELNLKSFSFWLLISLISFYFVGNFISQKLPRVEVSPIFNIYNTSLFIYLFTGVLLFHSSLVLKEYICSKYFAGEKIIYPLLSILYILILLNL